MSDVESQQQAKDAILALVDMIMYPPFGVEPGDAMMDGIDAVLKTGIESNQNGPLGADMPYEIGQGDPGD